MGRKGKETTMDERKIILRIHNEGKAIQILRMWLEEAVKQYLVLFKTLNKTKHWLIEQGKDDQHSSTVGKSIDFWNTVLWLVLSHECNYNEHHFIST